MAAHLLCIFEENIHNVGVKATYKHKELLSCADVKLIFIWYKYLDIHCNIWIDIHHKYSYAKKTKMLFSL